LSTSILILVPTGNINIPGVHFDAFQSARIVQHGRYLQRYKAADGRIEEIPADSGSVKISDFNQIAESEIEGYQRYRRFHIQQVL
jgi:hypothetical protein